METKNSFRDHLNKSSEKVNNWPSWKKNVEHKEKQNLPEKGNIVISSNIRNEEKISHSN